MKAAVVENFGQPPIYREFTDPQPGEHEELVDVVAAGLHQVVRATAAGLHYSADDRLPLIPGVDGIARRSDGTLAYFGGVRHPYGTFAERAAVPSRMLIPLPDDLDPAVAAASLNPGMSGWNALAIRSDLQPGQRVAVLGATGASGQAAVQAARLLGAGEVIGIGRSSRSLETLAESVDHTIQIAPDQDWAGQAAALADSVDVVIDYLWGEPASQLLTALVAGRKDSTQKLTWVQVGTMAGPRLDLAGELLRSTNLQLIGSGLGSVPMADLVTQLPIFLRHLASGQMQVVPERRPLADVSAAWSESIPSGRRVVVLPYPTD